MDSDRAIAASPRPGPTLARGRLAAALWASFGFVALRFLLTPLRIKLLTVLLPREAYGSLMLIGVLTTLLTLVLSLGVFEYLLQAMPGRSPAEQNGVFRSALGLLGAVAAGAFVVAAAMLHRWPPTRLSADVASHSAAPAALLASSILIVGCTFGLFGTGRYSRARLLQVLASDAWFVPVAGLAAAGVAATGAVLWTWVGWLVLTAGVGLMWTAPLLRGPAPREPGRWRAMIRFGLPLLPMVLGDWLFRAIDQYALLAARDVSTVAGYALAANTAMVGYFAGTSVVDLLIAEFHRRRNAAAAAEPTPELRRMFTAMVRWSLAIGAPVAVLLAGAGRPLVRLLSSRAYDDAAALLPWVSLQPLLFLLNLVGSRLLAALGRSRPVGGMTLAAAALALGLNLTLTPRWGPHGAAVSTTAALAALTAALAVQLRPGQWWWPGELRGGPLTLALALMVGGFALRSQWPDGRPVFDVVLAVALCGAALLGTGVVRREDLALFGGGRENDPHV